MGKVVVILSSPRKGGNTETLAMRIADGARDNGHEIQVFRLQDMELNGCKACNGCKKSGTCVQNDQIKEVLEAIKASDGMIIATPVYYNRPAAQYLVLEDRTFSFLDPEFNSFVSPGKKLAVACTSGGDPAAPSKVVEVIDATFSTFCKFEPVGNVCLDGCMAPNVVAGNKEILDEAYAIGKKF